MKTIIGVSGRGGSGKTTFCRKQGYHLCVGQILREKYGPDYFAKNENPGAPEELEAEVRSLIEITIMRLPCDATLYIDGFPRNANQVQWIRAYCEAKNHRIRFIVLTCENQRRVTRLANRSKPEELDMVAMRELKECKGLFDALVDIVASGIPVDVVDNSVDEIDE